MAFSKAHKFDDAIQHFALLCDALRHPARILILKRIIDAHGEPVRVNALTCDMPISRQRASEHLKVLRDMSIVSCREELPHVYYSLNPELFNAYAAIFSLVTQAELKLDENYKSEIDILGARRRIGTAPLN